MAGVGCKYTCCAKAARKGWGQLLVPGQLQRPWLLACTTVAAGSYHGLVAVEAGDGDRARGMQVHQLHDATSDRKTESHPGPQAAPGTLTVDMLFHGSWSAPQAGT